MLELFCFGLLYFMITAFVALLHETARFDAHPWELRSPADVRKTIFFSLAWPVSVPYVIVRGIYRVCMWLVSDLSPFKKPE
jgi:hypothetical protein